MSNQFTLTEINSIFSSLDIPLIEKSIDEIQVSKDNFFNRNQPQSKDYKIVLRNGTAAVVSKENKNNAKLERNTN
jgi:hypothetical protein